MEELEKRAVITMQQLEKFSDNFLLQVNVTKTKALLVHNVVSAQLPNINYKSQKLVYVKRFKYLGVHISTKMVGALCPRKAEETTSNL